MPRVAEVAWSYPCSAVANAVMAAAASRTWLSLMPPGKT